MRADVIVMMPPLFENDLRFFQRMERLRVQAFIAQAAIEAFVVAILPWAARLDVQGFDPQPRQPRSD